MAEMQVEGNPNVNDMATMLANAMLSPLTEDARRPARIYVREYTSWDEIYPHLREGGRRGTGPCAAAHHAEPGPVVRRELIKRVLRSSSQRADRPAAWSASSGIGMSPTT
jgi:hypothetical protein